jgi:RAT1-interacting protein
MFASGRERILTAPYEERDGWEMNVMCVNGTMYFEDHISETKLAEKFIFFAV